MPVPVPIARAHTPAQGTQPTEGTGTGTVKNEVQGTGTGTVKNDVQGTGTGTGTVSRRPKIDAELILHGYHENGRYDPVQTAMAVFGIPVSSNGRNNARILRWHVRRLGEDTFRQVMYDQWRENTIDGAPESLIAAFTRKLFKAGGDVR